MRRWTELFLVGLLVLMITGSGWAGKDGQAGSGDGAGGKNAIVLAMFGTTVEPALKGLLTIRDELAATFPATPVRIAFTSNIIRGVWRERAKDPAYVAAHPEIPADILAVQGVLAAIANLQDAGYDTIVVQPTLIAAAEEFHDLSACVQSLNSIRTMKPKYKPFQQIVIGRPALGAYSLARPYGEDIMAAARVLAEDARQARQAGAALVYMGHGNEHFPSGGLYLEFAARMRELYPETFTVIGTVEGFPAFDDVLAQLKHAGVKKVLLKPFMVVAGDHAMNDMAGPEVDSWKSRLEKEGISVVTVQRGLGEEREFARLFVRHAMEAARDAGIVLH